MEVQDEDSLSLSIELPQIQSERKAPILKDC